MKTPAVVARKFQIERLLGQGGMGQVYLARDPRLGNRRVAIKLLRVDSEEARHRFEQEASSAANLHHRNIVIIYEYGDHEGQPYIAMEFIEGDPLSAIIMQQRPLSIGRKLELLDDLCAGLTFAHQQGIVHRDVKPGNLLLDRDGCLKIVDFGIARAQAGSGFTVGTIGTPNYMSPEQVNGETVDRRSDIFAVGLVAYELISYRMAFPGESGRVYDLIRYRDPEPLGAIVANCDARLSALVHRAIAKRPQDRYQQLDELRADLATIRRSLGIDDQKPIGERIETVVDHRPTTPQPNVLDRAALARRRQRIVEDHIAAGKIALEAGDLESAHDRFEQAAALDDLNPQAIELLELARDRAIDRQVQELVGQAEAQLSASQLTMASDLVEQALALRSGDERAGLLKQAIETVRTVRDALDLARKHLANNVPDAALRAASEALAHDPLNAEALELTQRALVSIGEAQRQKRRQQQSQETIARAQGLVNARRFETALGVLRSFDPPDAAVASMLAEIQQQLTTARSRLKADSESVEQALTADDFARAESVAKAAADLLPDDAAAQGLLQRVEKARADRAARERAVAERAAAERAATERAATERAAAERAVAERVAAERAAAERAVAERVAAERAAAERAVAERVAAERAAAERVVAERAAAERAAAPRAAAPVAPIPVPTVKGGEPAKTKSAEVSKVPSQAKKSAVPLGLVASLLVAVVAIGGYALSTRRNSPPASLAAPGPVSVPPGQPAEKPSVETPPVTGQPEVIAPGVSLPATVSSEAATAVSKSTDTNQDARLASAKTAFDQHRYTQAVRLYQEILSTSPGHAEATTNLALARSARAGQVQAVKELLDKGDAYRKERAYTNAIQSFQSALTEDPDNRAAAEKLGEARAAQRRADQAANDILGKAPNAAPSSAASEARAKLLRQANALLDAALFDDAISTFDGVLKNYPGDPEATAGRNKAMARKNDKAR